MSGGSSTTSNNFLQDKTIVGKIFGDHTNDVLPAANWVANWLKPNDPGDGGAAAAAAAEEARKAALRTKINQMYGIGDEAAAAKMAAEEKTLGDANRSYYTDELNRDYAKAERNTRFNVARQGLLGGSEASDKQLDVTSDRDLGASRLDDAVNLAVNNLKTQREQERLTATSLVNAGEGDNAVLAASRGLNQTLANASSANKQQLFGDLFAGGVDQASAQNANLANAALLARYKQGLATYFAPGSTGGKVTGT